jgi:hypothetical protein
VNELTVHQPEGLAVDTAGNLYVADRGNHRALMYMPQPWRYPHHSGALRSQPSGRKQDRHGSQLEKQR